MKYAILCLALIGCIDHAADRAIVATQATEHQILIEKCLADSKISHMNGVSDADVSAAFEVCLKNADAAARGTDAGAQ